MTTSPLRIGLLPHYLALYDTALPDLLARQRIFADQLAAQLEGAGVSVLHAPVCRVAADYRQALTGLEAAGAQVILSLHLSYAPSLASIDALCASRLPLVLLDTTPDADFGLDAPLERLLANHGIHGVMDLASVMRRRGRAFSLIAGHLHQQPQTLPRLLAALRGAAAAAALRGMKVLRVGPTFEGMGDFQVEPALLAERFGLQVEEHGLQAIEPLAAAICEEAIDSELAEDRRRYDGAVDEAAHRRSLRAGLGLRALLEQGDYGALSVNFQVFTQARGPLSVVPFLEVSKAMARGIGYAGEGDALTAALTAALLRAFPQTTFTEIFCPDWQGQALFLSHMAELNPTVMAERPRLVQKPWPFSAAADPVILAGSLRAGTAWLLDLVLGPEASFSLIAAPLTLLGDGRHPSMQDAIRGWARPRLPLADFLEAYSLAGGTHHHALVYDQPAEAIEAFARSLHLPLVRLE